MSERIKPTLVSRAAPAYQNEPVSFLFGVSSHYSDLVHSVDYGDGSNAQLKQFSEDGDLRTLAETQSTTVDIKNWTKTVNLP